MLRTSSARPSQMDAPERLELTGQRHVVDDRVPYGGYPAARSRATPPHQRAAAGRGRGPARARPPRRNGYRWEKRGCPTAKAR